MFVRFDPWLSLFLASLYGKGHHIYKMPLACNAYGDPLKIA